MKVNHRSFNHIHITISLRTENEAISVMHIFNRKRIRSQEIPYRLALGRVTMESLKKRYSNSVVLLYLQGTELCKL